MNKERELKKINMLKMVSQNKAREGESACSILFSNEAYRLEQGPWVTQPDVKLEDQNRS